MHRDGTPDQMDRDRETFEDVERLRLEWLTHKDLPAAAFKEWALTFVPGLLRWLQEELQS